MFDWFEKLVREAIWKALNDFFNDLSALAEQKIREKLQSLQAGDQLSTTPLIRVTGVDLAADTFQVLVRGAFTFSGITPFMRLEVAVSRSEIDLSSATSAVKIKRWIDVLGELRVEKKSAFEGSLGFGYDSGAWLGLGSLKLVPLKIGAAIYGGISERGIVLELNAELPPGAAIPLGPTGLGLRGIGGDFAYNFVAHLETDTGQPVTSPTAKDYVAWARNHAIDRWQPGPIDRTAVGVGIKTVLCTIADQGFIFELNPIGLAFLVPGGAIILGGKGVLLRRKGFGVEGYFVIDIASASLALGAGVKVEIKAPPEDLSDGGFATLLKGFGQLDGFFSFSDPTAWFFDLGTETKPCYLEVLTDVPVINILFSEKAEAYLRINHHRVAFGAKVGLGGEYRIAKIIRLVARLAVALAAYIGWDPMLVRARLSVLGELGIKVWKFSFLLKGEATPTVYLPQPTLFTFEMKVTLDLPWPIPDVSGSKKWGDDIATPPKISAPLLAGEAIAGGFPTMQAQHIIATHVVSDQQWDLDGAKPWPDLELVVPFQARVTDATGAIIGPIVSPVNQAGYNVAHTLTKLELRDLTHDTLVPNVKALWADGPGGGTTQLHVLGTDPLTWLTPHTDIATWTSATPPKVVDVFFGYGPAHTFSADRAFGDLHVVPRAGSATLDPSFAPAVPTRVLRGNDIKLRVVDALGNEIPVDEIILFVITAHEKLDGESLVTSPTASVAGVFPVGQLYGSFNLVAQYFAFTTPVTHFAFAKASGGDLLVYAVRYREARKTVGGATEKTILVPGRYRLSVAGNSSAVHEEFSAHPDIYPSAPAIAWHAEQEFEVTYPETTRPYVHHSTFGDVRPFARQQHPWTTWTASAWNPTLFGIGFPLYRSYHVAVRFLVSYIGAIFSSAPLKLHLIYEAGGEVKEQVAPTAVPDGSSSMLPQSQNWIAANGGTVPADAELVMAALPPQAGMAKLEVLVAHPGQGELKLDEWTGYVSAFADFRSHLAWPQGCVAVRYDAEGRHVAPACTTIAPKKLPWHAEVYELAKGIDPLPKLQAKVALPYEPLLPLPDVIFPLPPYPVELTSPPISWRLPASLSAELGPLDANAAVRFARFAAATGARFGSATDPLIGVQDPVTATTIEAIVDSANRPFALWLRTPEPVDWRRVTIALSVSHVVPANGCPTGYAHRRKLQLSVGVLPNADGSAALLTGSLAGVPTRLPRGEYLLTLSFDASAAGLPSLRPSVLVGPGPEVVKLRFIQPFGADWPLPGTHGGIRFDLIELALKYVKFDPKIWEEAALLDLPAHEVEARLVASIARLGAGDEAAPASPFIGQPSEGDEA
ncbi:hypothetical protein [Myxococcus xanthus]|uniref:Uncharacterized protein n=1 Tax=Myxococcus xanthus TaxID=34 RepID=A0A7Y4IIL4_MYXXA|nr:hypothetical protein [Myxococcus xanthus]NOJ79791.1 hypothetical protein [Myxococcus xanthus]NOJ86796.1 hypothetical protein [Myxococcus xanthus]